MRWWFEDEPHRNVAGSMRPDAVTSGRRGFRRLTTGILWTSDGGRQYYTDQTHVRAEHEKTPEVVLSLILLTQTWRTDVIARR